MTRQHPISNRTTPLFPYPTLFRSDHVIQGRAPAAPESRSDIYNPATGEVSAQLALGGAREVDMAVKAALDAFPGWAATPPHVRARALLRFRDLIERDVDRLAAMITAEHGKELGRASLRARVWPSV